MIPPRQATYLLLILGMLLCVQAVGSGSNGDTLWRCSGTAEGEWHCTQGGDGPETTADSATGLPAVVTPSPATETPVQPYLAIPAADTQTPAGDTSQPRDTAAATSAQQAQPAPLAPMPATETSGVPAEAAAPSEETEGSQATVTTSPGTEPPATSTTAPDARPATTAPVADMEAGSEAGATPPVAEKAPPAPTDAEGVPPTQVTPDASRPAASAPAPVDALQPIDGTKRGPLDQVVALPATDVEPTARAEPSGYTLVDTEWELCVAPSSPRPPGPPPDDRSQLPAAASADEAEFVREGTSTLSGDVVVERADQRFEADRVRYDANENTVQAEGDVRYRDYYFAVRGQAGAWDLDTDTGTFQGAEFQIDDKHGYGTAELVRRDAPDVATLKQVTYTTCDPERIDWQLRARDLKLDRAADVGTARHATLRFKNVPFLYTPYITFPLSDKRKSGFLLPSIGNSDRSGFDLEVPYYWNIAPNQDATIAPRYLSKRGLMLGGEYRYLQPTYRGTLAGEFLPNDDEFDGRNRWAVAARHQQLLPYRWNTVVDYNRVSDKQYLDDLGNSLSITSLTHLPQRLDLARAGSFWNFLGRVEAFQTLDETIAPNQRPYKRLPQLRFNALLPDQHFGLTYGLESELVNFDRTDSVTGTRLFLFPSVSLPWRRPGGFLIPRAGFFYTLYNLEDTLPGSDDTPSTSVPMLNLDGGLVFERDTRIWAGDFTQTLEPRLFYLYVPYEDQSDLILDENGNSVVFDTGEFTFNRFQLFRDNRFSGPDRIGDANQLSVALSTRLLNRTTGREQLKATIGQIFYFRTRKVTLPNQLPDDSDTSDFVADLSSQLSRAWSFRGGLLWDDQDTQFDKGNARFQYRPDAKHILNLSYRYDRSLGEEQTDVSLRWPLTRQIYAVGRWNYSLEDNRTLEAFAGFEYDTCCWTFRLVGRNWISTAFEDDNTAVYVQLELKGLTSLGNSVESLLEEGILGYESD